MHFLQDSNLEQNTILIIINDNGVTEGLDIYNANMRGPKCSAWEGGTRAYSFWRWTGKWKPKIVKNLTAHLDIFPTLCEYTETKVPDDLKRNLDGHSLRPLLENENWNHNKRYFSTMLLAGQEVWQPITSIVWQALDKVIT